MEHSPIYGSTGWKQDILLDSNMKSTLTLLAVMLAMAACTLTRHPRVAHELFETDFDYACSKRFNYFRDGKPSGVGGSICGHVNKDCCKPIWRNNQWQQNDCYSSWGAQYCVDDDKGTKIEDLEYSNTHKASDTKWRGVYCDDECAVKARNFHGNPKYNVQVCEAKSGTKSCCKFGCDAGGFVDPCNKAQEGSEEETAIHIEDCTVILNNKNADNLLPRHP